MAHVVKSMKQRTGVMQMAHTVQDGSRPGARLATTALEVMMSPLCVVRVEEVFVSHLLLLLPHVTRI